MIDENNKIIFESSLYLRCRYWGMVIALYFCVSNLSFSAIKNQERKATKRYDKHRLARVSKANARNTIRIRQRKFQWAYGKVKWVSERTKVFEG